MEQPLDEHRRRARAKFLGGHSIRPLWYPQGEHHLIAPLLDFLVRETTGQSGLLKEYLDAERSSAWSEVVRLGAKLKTERVGYPPTPDRLVHAYAQLGSEDLRSGRFEQAVNEYAEGFVCDRTRPTSTACSPWLIWATAATTWPRPSWTRRRSLAPTRSRS